MSTLALDVGFRHTGWAVIANGQPVACGCIHTGKEKYPSSKCSQAQRDIHDCKHLARRLRHVAEYHSVTQVVGEVPGGAARAARALACMAMAKAAAGVALADYRCTWLAPRETKGAAVARVTARWPDFVPPALLGDAEHVYDALSVWIDATEGGVQ